MAKVYLIEARQGDYDDKMWWPVSVWESKRLAEREAERLNECSRMLRDAAREDPMPNDDDQYEAWRARRAALLRKWQRISGDSHLDDYDQPTYSVVALPMKRSSVVQRQG